MTKTNRLKHSILGFLSFSMAALPGTALFAAEQWMDYTSGTNVYQSRMPEGVSSKISEFLFSDHKAVRSEETSILVDQRPYKNAMKSYVIKFDQTLGPALSVTDVSQILQQEFKTYTDYYKNFEGVVRQQSKDGYDGFLGGEIQISYRDPTFGIQSIRARILFSDSTRLQQIVVGPDELMNSFSTRDFYDSLKFNGGLAAVDGTFTDKWKTFDSPSGMFSFAYPAQKAPPYYTTEPTVKFDNEKNEYVGIFFHDPVRNEKIFFNLYGYQFSTDVDFEGAQEVLIKRHIIKQRGTANGVKFKKGMEDQPGGDATKKIPYLETSYAIHPPTGFPYINMVKLKAYFAGKTMLVEETMTSSTLQLAALAQNLPLLVRYNPESIHDPVQPEIKSLDAAAEQAASTGSTTIIEHVTEPTPPASATPAPAAKDAAQ